MANEYQKPIPEENLDYLRRLESDLRRKGEVYSASLLNRLLERHAALSGEVAGLREECNATGSDECVALRRALTNARAKAREEEGLTTRGFAMWCGVSPVQLCKWTGPPLPKELPDFVDTPDTLKIESFQRNV